MAQVTVSRRLRPIRFAFLIEPNNMDELLQAFQVNTILWGGRYNYVVPAWSHRKEGKGREIASGFLRAVEPDFVVTGKADASRFGVPEERALSIDEFLANQAFPKAGLSVVGLYGELYEKEFRFQLRHPEYLARVRADTRLAAFCAARFGDFPGGTWSFLESRFRHLGAEDVQLHESNYQHDLLRCVHPLMLGSDNIDVSGLAYTAFLLLNPESFVDLVDFWNLRALGWRVLPIPVDWSNALVPVVNQLLEQEHKPVPQYVRFLTAGHILKSRTLSINEFNAFVAKISAPESNVCVSASIPRYWRYDYWEADMIRQPRLSAAEGDLELDAHDRRISFSTLAPGFADFNLYMGLWQWANVIRIRSWELPEIAEVIPPGLHVLADSLRGHERESYRINSEGFAVLDYWKGQSHFWSLPDGLTVFKRHLQERYSVDISPPGVIARRMIQMLGRPEWAGTACAPPMIRLFEQANSRASRCVAYGEVCRALNEHFHKNQDHIARTLAVWLEDKIVDMGLQIQCSKCGQANWFALNSLSMTLTCQRCLEQFSFPATAPKAAKWAIRPLGPFAIERQSYGAYVVVLAIRFFRTFGGSPQTTWTPSIELEQKQSKKKLELDFAVLWQRRFSEREPISLVIGECKTSQCFERADVAKMYALAKSFPGAYVAFVTLNNALTPAEEKMIRAFALWGRRESRNQVIVLTARELTEAHGVPYCWNLPEEAHVAGLYKGKLMGLSELAAATQQISLKLQPDIRVAPWP